MPLSTLLRHAGVRPEAVCVTPVGLDASYVVDGIDHGRVRRPLPLAKALDDVLVALDMNDAPLPARPRLPGTARRARVGRASRASSGSASSG